jgi:hypothetical protein
MSLAKSRRDTRSCFFWRRLLKIMSICYFKFLELAKSAIERMSDQPIHLFFMVASGVE